MARETRNSFATIREIIAAKSLLFPYSWRRYPPIHLKIPMNTVSIPVMLLLCEEETRRQKIEQAQRSFPYLSRRLLSLPARDRVVHNHFDRQSLREALTSGNFSRTLTCRKYNNKIMRSVRRCAYFHVWRLREWRRSLFPRSRYYRNRFHQIRRTFSSSLPLPLLYKREDVRKDKGCCFNEKFGYRFVLPCVSWCSSSVSPSSLTASSFSPRFYPPFPFSLPFCPPFIHFKSEAYRGYSGSLGDFGSIVFIVASQVSSSLVDREYSSQS